MAGHFLAFSSSSRSSVLAKPLTASFFEPLKRYSKTSSSEKEGGYKKSSRSEDLVEERAPSTAKEFERVAEEKQKEAEKGRGSQTSGNKVSEEEAAVKKRG